jgi:hypothetical protein
MWGHPSRLVGTLPDPLPGNSTFWRTSTVACVSGLNSPDSTKAGPEQMGRGRPAMDFDLGEVEKLEMLGATAPEMVAWFKPKVRSLNHRLHRKHRFSESYEMSGFQPIGELSI